MRASGVGELVRRRRRELRLTLERLAELAGCSKGYLSTLETGRRASPPSAALVGRLESALSLRDGELRRAAAWQQTPAEVRREVERLASEHRAVRRLVARLGAEGIGQPDAEARDAARAAAPVDVEVKSLDELHRSGVLRALAERLGLGDADVDEDAAAQAGAERGNEGGLLRLLPVEVPLINSVRAGYPTEFTDLGYPARVADEYVRSPDINDADAFAARVVGDSMEPEYREGDIVIFSPAQGVRDGDDCFARLEPDHETTFKRVFFDTGPSGEALIRLQPLNSTYPPTVLPRERVAGLYAAVSVTRKLR